MEGNLRNLITALIIVIGLIKTSNAATSLNTSPVLDPIEDFVYRSAEVSGKRYIQIRVSDLLSALESSTDKDVLYDLEHALSYRPEHNTEGTVDLANNMGIALVRSKVSDLFANLYFQMAKKEDQWIKFGELSATASKLLNPNSIIRFDINSIPRGLKNITISFKLWDLSNSESININFPQDTSDGSIDSPFSKDTQVVYIKIPWDLIDS